MSLPLYSVDSGEMIRCPLHGVTAPENDCQRAFLIRRAFLFNPD
jgi:hypothetical protein